MPRSFAIRYKVMPLFLAISLMSLPRVDLYLIYDFYIISLEILSRGKCKDELKYMVFYQDSSQLDLLTQFLSQLP